MINKNIISIDIGTSKTKLVVGNYSRKNINILNMVSFITPSSSINDGRIIDLNKLKDTIKETLDRLEIRSNKVIFTLDSTAIITRELTLPYAKDEDLKKVLDFEIYQHFPTDLGEYIIQAKRLENFEEDGVKKTKVLVAALPKFIVKTYLELTNSLGLEPIALDVHFNGISKLFNSGISINNKLIDKNQTVAIIDLGYENINVNIINKNILRFNRLLTVGGKEINSGIANNFNFTPEEAEKVKLEQATFEDDNGSSLYVAIENVIRGCIDNWLEEIQRIFKFYTSRSPENRINKIYLCGGHASLKNINKYFQVFFNIPTEKIETISSISISNNESNDIPIDTFLNAISAIARR